MADIKNRETYGEYTGRCFTVANGALTCKGYIDALVDGVPIELSSIADDPYALTSGLVFSLGSYALSNSKSPKSSMYSMVIYGVGSTLLLIRSLDDTSALIGTSLGLVSTSYAGYQYYKASNTKAEEIKEENKNADQKNKFVECMADILQEYPLLPTAVMNIVSSSQIAFAAFTQEKTDLVMAGICGLWILGSTFLGLSKPPKQSLA